MNYLSLACTGCRIGYRVPDNAPYPTCRTCGKRLVDTQSVKAQRREEKRQRLEWLRQVEGHAPQKRRKSRR